MDNQASRSVASSPTVLIIDDDEDIRSIIATILRHNGFEVATAAGGLDALQIVRSGLRPFLILLDLRMPIMSGEEFKKALDRLVVDPAQRIPVVILSGDGALAERTADMGAAGFVRKPIELSDLVELVKRYGDLHARGDSA